MVSPDFHSKRFVLVTTATSKDHLLGARETVLQCLYEVGLLPVIIHAGMNFELVQELLYAAAGVVFTGGPDVDPVHYNQESHEKTQASDPVRDNFELSVIKISDELNLPILAICRGAQILWVSAGGQLIQEVEEVVPAEVERHGKEHPVYQDLYEPQSSHPVLLSKNVRISQIFGRLAEDGAVSIPSMHHQAVDMRSQTGFQIVGKSPQGIAEIFLHPKRLFQLALQGHPEALIVMEEFRALPIAIFSAFAQAAKEYEAYVQRML